LVEVAVVTIQSLLELEGVAALEEVVEVRDQQHLEDQELLDKETLEETVEIHMLAAEAEAQVLLEET
jgi:hypothetical protein